MYTKDKPSYRYAPVGVCYCNAYFWSSTLNTSTTRTLRGLSNSGKIERTTYYSYIQQLPLVQASWADACSW